MYKTFCFIFAREGSKRIPNKNLQKINNRSLLRLNRSSKKIEIDEIFCFNDSKKILDVQKK